jgi:hypothetical protein
LLRIADTVTSQNVDISSWDTLYNYNYQIKEDEMGRICSTHGPKRVLVESQKEKDH